MASSQSSVPTKLIEPISRPFDISMSVPGSKSIALRQLVLSALANQPSTLVNVPECDDIDAMKNCLSKLGVHIEVSQNESFVDPRNFDRESEVTLDANMSGVTLRLLLAVAALRNAPTEFLGHRSLTARPNTDLLDALEGLGCVVESNQGRLPIRISPAKEIGNAVDLNASISSQFLSALLLIAPALRNGLTIKLSGQIASEDYVNLTLNEQSRRGISIDFSSRKIQIEPGHYAGGVFDVEGDASGSTYFMALATLHRSRLHVNNLGSSTQQGDLQFLEVCRQMGAEVYLFEDSFTIEGPEELGTLQNTSMEPMLDAAPTLMAMAPYLPEKLNIISIANLVYRECDRLHCPESELYRCGVNVTTTSDSMTIAPSNVQPAIFETYDDHRMAMSFAVLASRISGCLIRNPQCVSKTYTGFWNDFAQLYS